MRAAANVNPSVRHRSSSGYVTRATPLIDNMKNVYHSTIDGIVRKFSQTGQCAANNPNSPNLMTVTNRCASCDPSYVF